MRSPSVRTSVFMGAILAVLLLLASACSLSPAAVDAGPPPPAPPDTNPAGAIEPGTTTTGSAAPATTTTEAPTTTTKAQTTTRPPTTVAPTTAKPAPTTLVVPPTVPRATVPTTPPPPPPPPLPGGSNAVYVEGDSVLLGTTGTLPAALRGWVVTMDVAGSRRLTQAIPILQARRGEIGRVAVLMLGNNYIPGEGGPFGSQIDRAMGVLDGVDRVVWVTIAENLSGRAALNNEIRAAASRWPKMVIAEWAPIVAAHPDYASSDGLHLTNSGRTAISQLIATTVGPAPG